MNIRTGNNDIIVIPFAGYKLVVTVEGENIRIGRKRKLKKELREIVSPIIEHRK